MYRSLIASPSSGNCMVFVLVTGGYEHSGVETTGIFKELSFRGGASTESGAMYHQGKPEEDWS